MTSRDAWDAAVAELRAASEALWAACDLVEFPEGDLGPLFERRDAAANAVLRLSPPDMAGLAVQLTLIAAEAEEIDVTSAKARRFHMGRYGVTVASLKETGGTQGGLALLMRNAVALAEGWGEADAKALI